MNFIKRWKYQRVQKKVAKACSRIAKELESAKKDYEAEMDAKYGNEEHQEICWYPING